MAAEDEAEIQIRIQSIFDAQGAQEAKRTVDGLKSGQEDLNKESGKAILHGKEMRHIFRELNQLVPGLGKVMKAAFSPELIGVAGFLLVLQMLVEVIKKYREEAKKAAEARGEFLAEETEKSLDSVQKLSDAAATSAANISKAFEEVQRSQHTSQARIQEVTKALDLEKESIQKLMKAQEQLELAGADTEEGRARIKAKYGEKETQLEIDAALARRNAMREQVNRAMAAVPELEAASEAARAGVYGTAAERREETKRKAEEAIKADQERLKALGKEMGGAESFRLLGGRDAAAIQKDITATTQHERYQKELISALDRETEAAKAKADLAEKELMETRKVAVTVMQELNILSKRLEVQAGTAGTELLYGKATALAEAMPDALKALTKAAESTDVGGFLQSIIKLSTIPAYTRGLEVMINRSTEVTGTAIVELEKRVNDMDKRIKSSVNP